VFSRVVQSQVDVTDIENRPGQLILMDDPAFMPDMMMPALDFDFSNLDLDRATLLDTQGSLMSPRPHSRHNSISSVAGSVLGLVIPSSDVGSYQLPRNDGFQLAGSSAHKTSGLGNFFPGEEEGLIDDFDFEFDADGMMRDIDAAERDQLRMGSVVPQPRHIGSDSGASGRVRLDHEEARARRAESPAFGQDDEFIMQFDDELPIMPDAEAFTPIRAINEPRQAQVDSEASLVIATVTSSISAEAPLKKRKRRIAKTITPDEQIELANSDLRAWQHDYLKNMEAAIQTKRMHRAPFAAKKNAFSWVFGNGIGETGRGIGSLALVTPLEMFSGANLLATITGIPTASASLHSPKHPRDDDEEDIKGRRVRARPDVEGDQVGRGGDEDGFIPIFEESGVPEVGRDAPSALEDHASSAMPWNISASLHSFRNLAPGSSSIQGRSAIGGRQSSILVARPGSRLTSASPLLGRGQGNRQEIDRTDDLELPVASLENLDLTALGGEGRTVSVIEAEELEVFGPTAAADTQTAQTSQWIKEALARESLNFLEYVKNTLAEQETNEEGDDAAMEEVGDEDSSRRQVSFETLFPPETNSMMVAAQAFHHVLTLATKSLLAVRQDEAFGDIWMGVRVMV
jgi:meiotic recombination protein REC8, fungi type